MSATQQQQQQQQPIQFVPFSSSISPSFWHELARLKLDRLQLSEEPIPIYGHYLPGSRVLSLDFSSFEAPTKQQQSSSVWRVVKGTLLHFNTMENFKSLDKKAALRKVGLDHLHPEKAEDKEEGEGEAVTFIVMVYAELKRHEFTFLFGSPALRFPSAGDATTAANTAPRSLTEKEATLASEFITSGAQYRFVDANTLLVADPSDDPLHPGWVLRNVIAKQIPKISTTTQNPPSMMKITALCVRRTGAQSGAEKDIAFDITLPVIAGGYKAGETKVDVLGLEVTGAGGRVAPRTISLETEMDPMKLAESAVDLNLKLMRWRMFPALDLPAVASSKCLLLGAGTLGCNVARGLIGWGVRNITFVDNARVSFSNPVRQSLFTFEDCLNGGKFKAEAAAQRIKAIFPGVQAQGIVMTIPMPGHFVSKNDEPRVKEAVDKLEELVKTHDTIFLLGDSRECRWLPTLLGAVYKKLVINVGLGFDSFVVMRHGICEETPSGERLGCYFCSDVVAPRDSIRDRTLDQACTVTRPGISMAAAAMAVELFVSVMHSQAHQAANAQAQCPLGSVPHQLRCFLSEWNVMQLSGTAYDRCVACSKGVTDAFKEKGFEFLLQAFNNPTYLEDLTGITKEVSKPTTEDQSTWVSAAEGDDF